MKVSVCRDYLYCTVQCGKHCKWGNKVHFFSLLIHLLAVFLNLEMISRLKQLFCQESKRGEDIDYFNILLTIPLIY